MKKFIFFVLFVAVIIGSIVYFVFSSDKALVITYIKFNINPEFIIGVNSNDEVCIFNPLNEDAKILNLGMFNGNYLEDATSIILDKLDKANYLKDDMYITVMSKNPDKIEYFYEKINNKVKEKNKDLVLINKRASNEELTAYSNEVVYDVKATYDNNKLLTICNSIEKSLDEYVKGKIDSLKIDDLSKDEILKYYNEQLENGYFNDYDLLFYKLDDADLKIMDTSSYTISFDSSLKYTISLDLELERINKVSKKNDSYNLIEQYLFNYNNKKINNLKINFYKYK